MNNLNIFSSAHVKQDDRPATLASPIVVTQAKSACGSRFIMGKIQILNYVLSIGWSNVLSSIVIGV